MKKITWGPFVLVLVPVVLVVRVLRVGAGLVRVLRESEAAEEVAQGGVHAVHGLAEVGARAAAAVGVVSFAGNYEKEIIYSDYIG